MTQEQLPLYKIRDFGAKINATVEYIRSNFVPLLKVVLLIVVPVALLISLLMSNMFSSISQIGQNPGAGGNPPYEMLGALGMNYFLMILLSMLTMALMLSAIYGYMKMNAEQPTKPTPMEVYGKAIRKVPMLLVLMVLVGILTSVGFMFFFIPGLYLMVTLSLAMPIYLFEDDGIGAAFSKSFRLIKGKWWSTFGLLLITAIIAGIISYIFYIPVYVMMFGDMLSNVQQGGDPTAFYNVFSSWYNVLGMAIVMVGSYLTYQIPVIALSFQYFNLSERVEGRGIRDQIKDFEAVV